LKKYKLYMVRKIRSSTNLNKVADPLNKPLELPRRVPRSLQLRSRTLSFFPSNKKLNPQTVLGGLCFKYLLFQDIHLVINAIKQFISGAKLKNNALYLFFYRWICHFKAPQFGKHTSFLLFLFIGKQPGVLYVW